MKHKFFHGCRLSKRFLLAFLVALTVLTPIMVSATKPTLTPDGPLPWPFEPTDKQHKITGTLGEFRRAHLHAGVDIQPLKGEVVGTSVLSVSSGVVVEKTPPNTHVKDAHVTISSNRVLIKYFHIVPASGLTVCPKKIYPKVPAQCPDSSKVSVGTLLGTVRLWKELTGFTKDAFPIFSDISHLHLELDEGNLNPLDSRFGLTPYTDTEWPTINHIVFLRQGKRQPAYPSEAGVPVLDGKVEIRVNAKDAQSLGSPIVGVYGIRYDVSNAAGGSVGPLFRGFNFYTVKGYQLGTIYDTSLSTKQIYEYWVTNSRGRYSPPSEGSWYTGTVPDGHYKVTASACDIASNCADLTRSVIVRNTVRLDVSVTPTTGGRVYSDLLEINCPDDCSESYFISFGKKNAAVKMTAVPKDGFAFLGWGGSCSGRATCVVTMDADKTVTASFNKIQLYSLTVATSGAGHGTISGTLCGSNCTSVYNENTSITLTATAAARSFFAGWSGDCTGVGSSVTITMTSDKSCTAIFVTAPALSVLFLMDKSGSMDGIFLDNAKKTAKGFMEILEGRDAVGVIAFPTSSDNNNVQLVSDFSLDRVFVNKKIDGIRADGGTPLYDSILTGMNRIVKRARDTGAMGAMIVLSDGADNASQATVQKVIDKINANPHIKSFFIFAEHVELPGKDAAKSPYEEVLIFSCSNDPFAVIGCRHYPVDDPAAMVKILNGVTYKQGTILATLSVSTISCGGPFTNQDCKRYVYGRFVGYSAGGGSGPSKNLSENPLKYMADKTGRPYYNSVDAGNLSDIYLDIADQLGRQSQIPY